MRSSFIQPRRKFNLDDQAMIDAAVAEGRVTRIPTGQSGFSIPVWNAATKRLEGGDVISWHEQSNRSYEAKVRRDGKKRHTETLRELTLRRGRERRAKIWSLHLSGMSQKQIAAAMQTSIDNVSRNLTRYRKENGDMVRAAE